ncbi:MAG: hypothetical protein ACFFG0_43925 [Candidatus Thorarchaeota archaeon]
MTSRKSNIPERELKRNKSVTLTNWKIEKIEEYARKKGKSFSEIVRMGIDKILGLEK